MKDLSKKWWHRLITVIFIVSVVISIGIFSLYIYIEQQDKKPRKQEVISSQQMQTILANAPYGLDKKKIIDGLIQEGYNIEGVDNESIRQQLTQQGKIKNKHNIVISIVVIIIINFLSFGFIRYAYFFIITGRHKYIFNEFKKSR